MTEEEVDTLKENVGDEETPELEPDVEPSVQGDEKDVSKDVDAGGGPGFLVLVNVLMRFSMAVLFILGALYFLPDMFIETNAGDFTVGAGLFTGGAAAFWGAAVLDFLPTLQGGGGILAIANSFLYVAASAMLVVGSVWFFPDLYEDNNTLGNWLYVIGTATVAIAILWDMSRLLLMGAQPNLGQVVAMVSGILGAVHFMIGALFLFPYYVKMGQYDAVEKGANFFIAGACFFMMHALGVIKAYYFS